MTLAHRFDTAYEHNAPNAAAQCLGKKCPCPFDRDLTMQRSSRVTVGIVSVRIAGEVENRIDIIAGMTQRVWLGEISHRRSHSVAGPGRIPRADASRMNQRTHTRASGTQHIDQSLPYEARCACHQYPHFRRSPHYMAILPVSVRY